MILSIYMLKRVGENRHPSRTPTVVRNQSTSLSDSTCCSEPVSYAAVKEDGTNGHVTEVFDDSDKVGADAVLLYGCPQSCMPNPVEGLLEVYEDMVEVLLVLEIFLIDELNGHVFDLQRDGLRQVVPCP